MPKRINKAIELLSQRQPAYCEYAPTGAGFGYELGRSLVKTWADYIMVDMEHGAFDLGALDAFMRGLAEHGPTPSGHRTPAVLVCVPTDGSSEAVIRANAWQFRQVLARGVHGILLCHAETPEAVRAFVECCRYPFQARGEGLGDGRRGSAGQGSASQIWGVPEDEYLKRADPWPLNPDGELLLGIKIENRRALRNADASASVPGITFAEWGPGDMGFSLGHRMAHDPPYPPDMVEARERVHTACRAAGRFFLNMVSVQDVTQQLDEGVMLCAPGKQPEEAARIGRAHTARARRG